MILLARTAPLAFATILLCVPAVCQSLPPGVGNSTAAISGTDVLTYHFDIGRTGHNPSEVQLSPSTVKASNFALIRTWPVDGLVDAQPLYLSQLTIGQQKRNVVYAVTENDSVYAFDADTGAQIWMTSVLGLNETASDDHGCGQITPEIGITSTPVLDRQAGPNGAIFIVGMSEDASSTYHQRLHALDVTTGAELTGSPVEIQASYPGSGANSSNGTVVFDPGQYAERAGLLLMNGTIYLAFTSHCDQDPYTGWLMAYAESTLKQTGVLNLTPNGSEGSIWMAGSGLAADPSGNIYCLDANGTFDTSLNANGFPAQGDYGNGFLKISTAGSVLSVADYFEPYDTVSLSNSDTDLGSGGVIALPDMLDASGITRHLAVGAGKNKTIYLVDRDAMGKFNPNNNNAVYQEIDGALNGGVWSKPAFFNNTIYYGAVGDSIKAFPFTKAKLASSPSAQTADSFFYPGAFPFISSNGTANGIVWAVENSSPAVLRAYDAETLNELYNSNQAINARDHFGDGNKFITPVVADGKVFVGTPSAVAEFGLLNVPAALTSPTSATVLAGPTVTFTWSAASGATSYAFWLGSTAGAHDLYASGPLTATSATGANLPTNGETIYARLLTNFGSSQVYNEYTFTASTQAALTSPTPATVLAGPTVTFKWSAATGAPTSYAFWLGSTVGAHDLYASGPIAVTSVTRSGLPTNGETIHARLITNYGSISLHTDYTCPASTQAVLKSPTPGSTFTGSTVTFTWSAGTGAPTSYGLWLGTTAGAHDLYASGPTTATSVTRSGLPKNGKTIHARLLTNYASGTQVYTDYTYTAAP